MARDIGAWLEDLGLGRYADAFGESVNGGVKTGHVAA